MARYKIELVVFDCSISVKGRGTKQLIFFFKLFVKKRANLSNAK